MSTATSSAPCPEDGDRCQAKSPIEQVAQHAGASCSEKPPVLPETPSAETRQPLAGGVPTRHFDTQQIVMIALTCLVLDDPTRLEPNEAHIQEFEADFARRQKDHPDEHPIQTPLRVEKEGDKYSIIGGGHRFLAAVRRGLPDAPCIVLPHGLDAADRLIERVRDNALQLAYTPMEEARNIVDLMQLRPGIFQGDAARELGIKDETRAAKIIKVLNFFPADLHCKIGKGDGKVPFGSAYEFARLMEATGDEAKVRELTDKSIKGLLTRDSATKVVRRLLNGNGDKKPKRKALKITVAGVTMIFKDKVIEGWRSVRAAMDEAAKKLEKDGLPEEFLPALLKS